MARRANRTFWGRRNGARHLYRQGDLVEDGPAGYLDDDGVETARKAPGEKRSTKRSKKKSSDDEGESES